MVYDDVLHAPTGYEFLINEANGKIFNYAKFCYY